MLHKARRALEKVGIKPGSGIFTAIQQVKTALVDPLRRRAMARKGRLQEFLPPFPVRVAGAWDSLLGKHGLPPLGKAENHSGKAGSDNSALGLWILAKLVENPDQARRFPKALSEGSGGVFCRWLASGPLPDGVSPGQVESFFNGRPGDRVLRYIDEKEWVLRTLPLALTPAGRHGILDWLLGTTVRHLGECDLADVIWFALERSEDQTFGLAPTWLRLPAWQTHWPLGLTVAGAGEFIQNLKTRHPALQNLLPDGILGLDQVLPNEDQARLVAWDRLSLPEPPPALVLGDEEPVWFRDLEQLGKTEPLIAELVMRVRKEKAQGEPWRPGLNVLGHCTYSSGVGEVQRHLRIAVKLAGGRTAHRDVPGDWRYDQPTRPDHLGVETFDTTILSVPIFANAGRIYPRAGLARKPGVWRIGYWAWELDLLPQKYARESRHFDEIWTPTRFVAEAVRKAAPRATVNVVLPGAEILPNAPVNRARYGLGESDFVALFMFDVASVIERKNPLAVVEAFRRSLAKKRDARLVFKITRPSFDPDGVRALREAAASVNAIIIDEHLSRPEAYGIMDMCDCYISLHRSEGYGITIAEALLYGKTVIATGYSGNMDFMSDQTALVVNHKLVPITKKLPYYPMGCQWAEADIEQAAAHLQWVYDHPALAKRLGDRARVEVGKLLSMESYGHRVLRQIAASRDARGASDHSTTGRRHAA